MTISIDTLLKPFLTPYAASDIRILKKAQVLAPTTMTIGLLGLILGLIMLLTGAVAVAGAIIGLEVFCSLVLLLMAAGKYGAASSIFMYGIFLVLFAAIKFDEYRNVYECYVFATLGLFVLIAVGVIGSSLVHAFIVTLLNLAAIAILYIFDALPLDNGQVTVLAVQSLATSGIIVVASGLFTGTVIRMQGALVNESEQVTVLARQQYLDMTEAVAKANEAAFLIGRKLADASVVLSTTAKNLRDTASEESTGLAVLDDKLATNAAGEEAVIKAQDRVKASLEEYSRKVLGASVSVSRMIKTLDSIGQSAAERQNGITSLASLARDGKDRIAEVSGTIGGIVESTGRMDEMNTLIGEVAGRTNLLGMNASIEAAHAGDAGKGFSVVAEEIRTLSEEAAEGSRTIAEILSETNSVVAGATHASAETSEFFSSMSQEIQRVASSLEELLVNLRDISSGTTDISLAFDGFSTLAESAGKAVEDTGTALRAATARSAESRQVAAQLRTNAVEMTHSSEALLDQTSVLSNLGKENIHRMEELTAKVASMGKS